MQSKDLESRNLGPATHKIIFLRFLSFELVMEDPL